MTNRNRSIANFLKIHGWNHASRLPLANDASFRRYERLVDGTRRAILFLKVPFRGKYSFEGLIFFDFFSKVWFRYKLNTNK